MNILATIAGWICFVLTSAALFVAAVSWCAIYVNQLIERLQKDTRQEEHTKIACEIQSASWWFSSCPEAKAALSAYSWGMLKGQGSSQICKHWEGLVSREYNGDEAEK